MCIKVNPSDDGKTLGWEKEQWKSIYKHFFTYFLIEPPRQYLDMGDVFVQNLRFPSLLLLDLVNFD